jgi:monoamine oxidase
LSEKIVASESSDVLLGKHVTSVEHVEATKLVRVIASTEKGGDNTNAYYAKRVVFALPPSVLARTVSFKPVLSVAKLRKMAETATWCGDWCKLAAIFKTPFWREIGASGVVSTERELISIWYEGGSGLEGETAAITGLGFGVETCAEVERTLLDGGDPAVLESYVVSMLGPALGEKKVREQLVKVGGKSWAVDDLTYSSGARGREYGHPLLRQPTKWGVHFAGSETERMNGHVEGAIVAGMRAAKEVLAELTSN